MENAKVKIKVGKIEFSGEGSQKWLSEQLDKILDKADKLIKISNQLKQEAPNNHQSNHSDSSNSGNGLSEIAKKTLPAWLKSKSAETNQNNKFLATAMWLMAKGKSRFKTGDVTKALKDANQKRLGNASETLKQNVKKGFCEKDGSEYYVTEEGKASLGIS